MGNAAYPYRLGIVDCSIDVSDDNDLSVEADLAGGLLVGVYLPAAFEATTAFLMPFALAETGGTTLYPIKDVDGTAKYITITAATNTRFVPLDPSDFAGVRYLKLKPTTSDKSTAVVQTVDRVIKLVTRLEAD